MGAPSYSFSGEVVVVTGAARGQGLSHALAFAKCGARVVGVDCSRADEPSLQYGLSTADDLHLTHARLVALASDSIVLDSDIRSVPAQRELADEIKARFGVIDVIIHNAGINVVQDFASTNRGTWDALAQTNLAAPFFLTQTLAPLLNPNGSSVVFVSSLAAVKGIPRQAAYSASKAGLLALTRCLAVELGSNAVRVNAICPSLVVSPQSTGLAKALRPLGEQSAPASLGVLAGIGTLRPEHVTDIVLWLASSGSRCITGQIVVADAGRSL